VKPRARTFACVATVLGVLVYLWLRHHTLPALLLALGIDQVPLHDFYYFYYPMGAKVLAAPEPIEGFLYSPLAALSFVPIGALPYAAASWTWSAILLLLTAALAWESVRPFQRHAWLVVLTVGLVASSMPVLHNHKFGQVSPLVVVPILLCVRCYESGRPYLAAALLMFAVAFKFYPAPFLFYFVFKRDWRFLTAAAAFGALFFAVLPAVALGPADTLSFYQNVARQIEARFGGQIADQNSQSFLSLSHRLLIGRARLDASLWRPILAVARYVCCAGLLFVVFRTTRGGRPGSARRAFLWLFAASPFFVATSWPHYFVYLPAIVAATLGRLADDRRGPPLSRALAAVSAVGAAAVSSMFLFDLIGNCYHYSRWGYLFFANLLALAALGFMTRLDRATGPSRALSSAPPPAVPSSLSGPTEA
jgi:alpha-1,2-mannosyltransferase